MKELGNQFIHNKCHVYGWCDNYLFQADGRTVGYGSVWGLDDRHARDCFFECFVLEEYRQYRIRFAELVAALPGVHKMEAQSNDPNTQHALFSIGNNIEPQAILFQDKRTTQINIADTQFRKRKDTDIMVQDDDGPYILEYKGDLVAHGGYFNNYNFPYSDIYMHVLEPYRRRGFGSLLVQELKKVIYEEGRVPAARCNIKNHSSKATLEKAGFEVCGYLLTGDVRRAL